MANSERIHIDLVGGSGNAPLPAKSKKTRNKSKARGAKGAKVSKVSLRKDARAGK